MFYLYATVPRASLVDYQLYLVDAALAVLRPEPSAIGLIDLDTIHLD